MTHKRYKVITTIDNIVIVLLIVKAVQKNFLCSFLFSMIFTWVFLGFWFAGLNIKFSCPKKPYFTNSQGL